MARGRKQINMDVINKQIEVAEEDVVKTKQKYDAATDRLKELLDKKKAFQMETLMNAVMKSRHSYDDILRYINSDVDNE